MYFERMYRDHRAVLPGWVAFAMPFATSFAKPGDCADASAWRAAAAQGIFAQLFEKGFAVPCARASEPARRSPRAHSSKAS